MIPNIRLFKAATLPVVALCLVVAAVCSAQTDIVQADRVIVVKSERTLKLLRGNVVLKSYKVALGRQPVGRKSRQGDCKTPEGLYTLDRRNQCSTFYRALHISYPNAADIASARKNGVKPGKDIMIHGLPKGFEDLADVHATRNWTKGCIAVSNAEIDEIWRLVPNGIPIEIRP